LARQLVERFLPILGILTASTYAVLRLGYAHFYYYFEVSPEEVGLRQFELLSQSLVGLALFLVVILTVTVILTLPISIGFLVLERISKWLQQRTRFRKLVHRWRARWPFQANVRKVEGSSNDQLGATELGRTATTSNETKRLDWGLWLTVGILAAICILAYFVIIFRQADDAGRAVRDGYKVSAIHFRLGTFRVITLNVRATHSTVEWKATRSTPSALKSNAQCLMYFGKADGTAILFNVKDDTTIRFPAEDAVITVHPGTKRLPVSCYE
jgi:hypothetical protein